MCMNQTSLCVCTHILDVYNFTPWTKLYNILLLKFLFQFGLSFSAFLFEKPTVEMDIVIYMMMKCNGPNQVFEFHHI